MFKKLPYSSFLSGGIFEMSPIFCAIKDEIKHSIFFSFFKTNNYKAMNNKTTSSEALLTKREAEILEYIASGKSSRLISGVLSISKQTVDKHRKNMLKKMGAKNSMQLVQAYFNQFL